MSTNPRRMFHDLAWPFPGDEFPTQLGAVVALTVSSGQLPALQVVHSADNTWLVADGLNDPNEPGACHVEHMSHVVECNSSVGALARLPPGFVANRDRLGSPWVVSPFEYAPDE